MEKQSDKNVSGYGPSLIIGGKKFNNYEIASLVSNEMKEVHTVSGMENMPKQVHKEFKNEAGKVQTNIGLNQGQSYQYDFKQSQQKSESGHQQGSQAYSAYQYNESSSYQNNPYNEPYREHYNNNQQRMHTENIVTSSQIEADSQKHVTESNLNQTNYNVEDYVYLSSNAQAGQTAAQSLGIAAVGSAAVIRTMENPEESGYGSGKGNAYASYSSHTTSQSYNYSNNIETTSSKEAMSQERVQDYIYHSSDAEAGQTAAQSLGIAAVGRAAVIHTLLNPVESEYVNANGNEYFSYSRYTTSQSYNHSNNIETASDREAMSKERVEDLIYHSSNVKAGQTAAQSLGMEADGRATRIHTLLNPMESAYLNDVSKEQYNNRKKRVSADKVMTGSSMEAEAAQRVKNQSVAGNSIQTSQSMQGLMTGGMQAVSTLKMMDAIHQNRGGDGEESFEDSMMPAIKSGIKAGIMLSAVGGVSDYLSTYGENKGMSAGESGDGQIKGRASWLNPKRTADYIRSMSAKKGGVTFRGITMDKSKGMTSNVHLVNRTNDAGAGIMGGGFPMWRNLLQKRSINTGINPNVTTGRTIQTAVGGGAAGIASIAGIAGMWNPLAGMFKNSWLKQLTGVKNKLVSFITDPGASPTSSFLDMFKTIGGGILIPLLLLVVGIGAGSSTLSVPVMAASSFFGGVMELFDPSGNSAEFDIRTFITNDSYGIPSLRDEYITDLVTELQGYRDDGIDGDIEEDDYDIVRLKVDDNESFTSLTYDAISAEFYTEAELTNMIQPIFTAYILMEYNLQSTEQQAKDALSDIFEKLVVKTVTDGATEHCGQDLATGVGTVMISPGCNAVHDLDTCPNSSNVTYHTGYTCSRCCHYDYCDGHQGNHVEDVCEEDCQSNHTYYCGGYHVFDCDGHTVCNGHSVKNIHLSLDGIYLLMEEYFLEPIRTLESAVWLSDSQKEKLQLLKDCLEICEELIMQVYSMYGLEMTKADLLAVEMIPGSRTDGDRIIQIALSQVGYAGGYRYWSYMGFSQREEWCACFVSWCMHQVEHDEVYYTGCQSGGVYYFNLNNRFEEGDYTDLAKGDVIFFDWDGDNSADHTGLVAGKDANYVYTIEGNSSDMVKIKKYELGHTQIMGYGLMYY